MIEIIIGMSFYNVLRNWLYLQGDKKIANSLIVFTHIFFCISSICLYYFINNKFLITIIVGNSCGYFINDTLKYIKLNRNKFSDYVMIYHHIATSLFIYNYRNIKDSYWLQALFWAEVSNIPNNIVYFFIQKNKLSDGRYKIELRISKIIQKYMYTFVRIFILSYYTIMEMLLIGTNRYFYIMMPLHIMGYTWSYVILTGIR